MPRTQKKENQIRKKRKRRKVSLFCQFETFSGYLFAPFLDELVNGDFTVIRYYFKIVEKNREFPVHQ